MNTDVVGAVMSQTERPSWVRFETVPVENKAETLKQGKWVGQDVDYVCITAPYSKDEHVQKVSIWKEQMDLQVMQGRIPAAWRDRYLAEYDAFKKGQELPVDGTPILGWGMISPAQQKILISCRIRTVEDLAAMNADGVRHVGMGAVDMKQRAAAWLAQHKEKGPLTVKMASVEAENRELQIRVDALTKQVEDLLKAVNRQAYTMVPESPEPVQAAETISAADLLDEDRPVSAPVSDHTDVQKRRGNPNWVKKVQGVI
mgnify:CR=1 FL=1